LKGEILCSATERRSAGYHLEQDATKCPNIRSSDHVEKINTVQLVPLFSLLPNVLYTGMLISQHFRRYIFSSTDKGPFFAFRCEKNSGYQLHETASRSRTPHGPSGSSTGSRVMGSITLALPKSVILIRQSSSSRMLGNYTSYGQPGLQLCQVELRDRLLFRFEIAADREDQSVSHVSSFRDSFYQDAYR
jgi:hypothetical protein